VCGTNDGACQVFRGGALRPSGLLLGVQWNVCRIECVLEWKQDEVNSATLPHRSPREINGVCAPLGRGFKVSSLISRPPSSEKPMADGRAATTCQGFRRTKCKGSACTQRKREH